MDLRYRRPGGVALPEGGLPHGGPPTGNRATGTSSGSSATTASFPIAWWSAPIGLLERASPPSLSYLMSEAPMVAKDRSWHHPTEKVVQLTKDSGFPPDDRWQRRCARLFDQGCST